MTSAPSGTPGRRAAGSWLRPVAGIRIDEVLLLQGTPLFGAAFALRSVVAEDLQRLLVLILASLCVVAHVFVANDWAGIEGDLRHADRASRTFQAKSVSRAQMGGLALVLLAISLLASAWLGRTTVLLTAAIAGLGALYSVPPLHLKGVPVASSLLHLSGGLVHFLLGYTTFAPLDARGVALGGFFALTFAAGHLTHETRDRDGDVLNGIRTNAVAFGKRPALVAGLVLFTLAYGLIVGLAATGAVPRLLVLAGALYPLHLAATVRTLRAGLDFASVSRLQRRYRVLYGAIGAMIVIALCAARWG